MSLIFLESPFGTIRFRFSSAVQCGVNLVEPGPVVVNNVKVEGVLQFALIGFTWVLLEQDSYVDNAVTHKPVSITTKAKLTTTAADLLNEWYRANPDAYKAIQAVLLEAKLTEEEAELGRLLDRTAQKKAVVEALKQQLTTLR